MGMMEQMTAPQEMPMQGGMMEGAALKGFNGVVQSDEGPIKVVNGKASIGGQDYIVSDDGRLVVDLKGNLVSIIVNNKAMPITPEIEDQLRQEGIIR